MNQVVIDTMQEKVQSQQRHIAKLQKELEQSQKCSYQEVLKKLKSSGAILLYVGNEPEKLEERLRDWLELDSEMANGLMQSAVVLDNSAVPPEAREAFKVATDYGMNKW